MTEYTDKQLAEMDKEAKDNIAINSGVKTKNKPITNEILDIRKVNKKLSKQCEDQMDQFRNKGVL